MEQKKNNIILFNLPEGDGKEEEKNKEGDLRKTKEVLTYVNSEVSTKELDFTKVSRIGSRKEKRTRPIKIVMDSPESKLSILRNARKLKDSDSFNKIGLSFDKTEKQKEEYRCLKERLQSKNQSTGSGKDYVIWREQITLRSEIPILIRKAKGTGWSSSIAPHGGNLRGATISSSADGKDASGSDPRD